MIHTILQDKLIWGARDRTVVLVAALMAHLCSKCVRMCRYVTLKIVEVRHQKCWEVLLIDFACELRPTSATTFSFDLRGKDKEFVFDVPGALAPHSAATNTRSISSFHRWHSTFQRRGASTSSCETLCGIEKFHFILLLSSMVIVTMSTEALVRLLTALGVEVAIGPPKFSFSFLLGAWMLNQCICRQSNG